jgi:hypothetical protein
MIVTRTHFIVINSCIRDTFFVCLKIQYFAGENTVVYGAKGNEGRSFYGCVRTVWSILWGLGKGTFDFRLSQSLNIHRL